MERPSSLSPTECRRWRRVREVESALEKGLRLGGWAIPFVSCRGVIHTTGPKHDAEDDRLLALRLELLQQFGHNLFYLWRVRPLLRQHWFSRRAQCAVAVQGRCGQGCRM